MMKVLRKEYWLYLVHAEAAYNIAHKKSPPKNRRSFLLFVFTFVLSLSPSTASLWPCGWFNLIFPYFHLFFSKY